MNLSALEDGSAIDPSKNPSSANTSHHQNATPVSATELLSPDNARSASPLNSNITKVSGHSQEASHPKGKIEPSTATTGLLNSSELTWNCSLDQGEGDSDLKIHIQSSCSIDMNAFEQMSSSTDKQTATGSSFGNESFPETVCTTKDAWSVTGRNICDEFAGDVASDDKQVATGCSDFDKSICGTVKESKEAATITGNCNASVAETMTKTEQTSRDLKAGNMDCHSTHDTDADVFTFSGCDSAQPTKVSISRPKSHAISNRALLDSNDGRDSSLRSPSAEIANASGHSCAKTGVSESSVLEAPPARLVEGSRRGSLGTQSVASGAESHSVDATDRDYGVKDVALLNTKGGTLCENAGLSLVRDFSAKASANKDASSIYGETERESNNHEDKETSATGENSTMQVDCRRFSQDRENRVDDENKMDCAEKAADPLINIEGGVVEKDGSTKTRTSRWSPTVIPTLPPRGNTQTTPERKKPLLSTVYTPSPTADRRANERQRAWQESPNQGPVAKRPTLGDVVTETESGSNRVVRLMELDNGGNEFYPNQAFHEGASPRPWNDGSELRPPFGNPHWNGPPPPGFRGPFNNGMPRPGPYMSLPPPGMPPQGLPPPGMPSPGMPPMGPFPPPGMQPPGIPVPPPGMMIPPSNSVLGQHPVGGMFMPPPPLVGMEPPVVMPWSTGVPQPPPNSITQPFSLPPPVFMHPPSVLPRGCMAPPGSVPPIYGMPPSVMLPPPCDPTQFQPPGMIMNPPYVGQYPNYGAPSLPPCGYSGAPGQSYADWHEWYQRYAQFSTTPDTFTPKTPTSSSTSKPRKDKAKHDSPKTTGVSKEKSGQVDKEEVASIALPPPKQKYNWAETKPPKPTSQNRLPNLTSLVARFHSDAKSKNREEEPAKEADSGSSENMLWIGNLPIGTRAVELRSTVSEYGKVCNCKVGALKSQKDAGLFALVTMETAEDAEYCIRRLNNSSYNGQSIIVKKFQKD